MKLMISIPLFLALLMLASGPAAATAIPEQLTVRELMRLENGLALEAARQRREAGGTAPASGASRRAAAPGSVETLRLVGIYGVGKRLFAEVRGGTQAFLFLRGQPLPVGQVDGDDVYRLKELAGACIRLVRREEETVLCLPRAGGGE